MVKVQAEFDENKLYDKEDVAELAHVSIRKVEKDAQDPTNPLKWTHKVGRRKCVDAAGLRAYLETFRL